ncbi:oligosaccharide flippase family protein [Intestinibaculum porci]|uniref:oligosaccharide flippase family protein n=1 Tax=Intestinibaculum porci TaxID=2487118 RepID=UPI0024096705|nr:oligosaccharide flippase family protein [Intestinibaculum porci]MDD6349138.1 oligosaccharide flippase family protein [Intestinibaculum porci]
MQSRGLKLGAIASYLWVAVHIITNFLYAPILIESIGVREYGLYQIIGSFFAYISIFESSMSSSVLRYYCQALNTESNSEAENILAICRSIFRKMALSLIPIGTVLIIIFRLFYASSFSLYEINEGSFMLGLLLANMAVTMLNSVYLSGINAQERVVFLKMLEIVEQIAQPILCYLVLFAYPYAFTALVVQLIISIINALIRYFYATRNCQVKVVLHHHDHALSKEIMAFSMTILLAQIADQIFWKADQIILGKLYSTAIVAVYSVGSQIYTNYMYTGSTVSQVFFPRISRLYNQEDGEKKISDLFIKVGRIAFYCSFLVLVTFIFVGQDFLRLWVGKGFTQAYSVALIVMVPFTIDIIQNIGISIMQVENKYHFRAQIYLLAAVLNIFSTAIMAKYMGMQGAALSTAIAMALTSGLIMNFYYYRSIHIDIPAFWKNIIFIIMKLIPAIIISGLIIKMIPNFLLKCLIIVGLYSIDTYFLAMNREEKAMVQSVVYKFTKRKERS